LQTWRHLFKRFRIVTWSVDETLIPHLPTQVLDVSDNHTRTAAWLSSWRWQGWRLLFITPTQL
jgi:hypothetical protein